MKVGQRLFLAVVPAILGVFTVAGLAYWGEYAHQAPRGLIIVASGAALLSLGMAWYNTRYVARRVERLVIRATGKASPDTRRPRLRDLANAVTGGVLPAAGGADELDAIESTVSDLNSAVTRARADGERRAKEAEAREAEYTAILEDVARVLGSQLEEAELPLHVLLSSPFGSLNENQEEMLTAAQSALDAADTELRQFKTLLALDRGTLKTRPHPVGLAELLKPALAIAQASALGAHVTVRTNISATAPRAIADPMQVQAALTTIFTHAVAPTPAGGEIMITADEGEPGRIHIIVHHSGASNSTPERSQPARSQPARSLELRLARRLILLQRGTLQEAAGKTVIALPSEVPMRAGRAEE